MVRLTRFEVDDQAEGHLIISAVAEEREPFDEDAAKRLLVLPWEVLILLPLPRQAVRRCEDKAKYGNLLFKHFRG